MTDTDKQELIDDIRGKIRDKATDRDSLTLLFVRLLELQRPDWQIEMVSEGEVKLIRPNGKSSSIYLPNLWVECEKEPGERLEIVERRIRILADDGDDKAEADAGTVIALIRDSVYREYVAEEERELIAPHLVGDLWVIYAIDKPESTDVMSVKQAAQLGLGAEELRKTSLDNLAELLTEIEAKPYGECYVISCENVVYASSLLLLDFVWDQLESLVEGDLVVGVPARDTVVFAGAKNAAALAELRSTVAYVTTTGHHTISDILLRRTNGTWVVFS